MPEALAGEGSERDERKVYSSEGEIPDDSEGRIDTINFDGVTARVERTAGAESYFTLTPPDAAPAIRVPREMSNEDVIAFVKANIAVVRDMRAEMVKRYGRGSSRGQRYETGEVAYVLGRPFMLRVVPMAKRGQMRHASRGRASTRVSVNTAVGLVELGVVHVGDFDQRKGTFLSWAAPILARNAASLCPAAAKRAGVETKLPANWRVAPMRSHLIRIDRGQDTVWVAEDLVPYPARCLVYAFMRALADEALDGSGLAGEELAQAKRDLIAAGCPEHEQARADLAEKRYA